MAVADENESPLSDLAFEHIVIETSALRYGSSIDGVNALFLAHYADKAGANLWVPEVAFGECTTLIRREVSKQREMLSRCMRELSEMGIEATLELPAEGTMIESATQEFQRKLDAAHVRQLPFPGGLDHHDVLTRLQAGRKPFRQTAKNKDIGYRDCLIWETVLGLAGGETKGSEDVWVAFVTSNTLDFAEKSDDRAVLHSELATEAEDRKLKVVLFESVNQFISQVVKPSVPLSDVVSALLSTPDWGQRLRSWLSDRVIDKAYGHELSDSMNWHGVEAETVGVSGVGELVDLEVTEVRELSVTEVVAEVECELEVMIDFFVFKSDAYTLDDEYFSRLSEWNKHYFRGEEEEVVITCLLEVGMQVADGGLKFKTVTISEIGLEEES